MENLPFRRTKALISLERGSNSTSIVSACHSMEPWSRVKFQIVHFLTFSDYIFAIFVTKMYF